MFFAASPVGDYDTYDKISRHPTVAEVMGIVLGPVTSNKWAMMEKDPGRVDKDGKRIGGQPTEWKEFVEKQRPFGIALSETLGNIALAVSHGFAPFEIVYKKDGGGIGLEALKPLDPKQTKLLADGNKIVGLRNYAKGEDKPEDLYVDDGKAYWFSYNPGFDPYGNPRHENIRRYWSNWLETEKRLARYLTKVAAIIVQMHYPAEGESFDPSSSKRPNEWIAQQRLKDVSEGRSLAFPNLFAGMGNDNPELAAALAGKSQWQLSAVEIGGSDHSKGILDSLAYYDKLLFRGWLRPERAGLEATKAGSRADSQSQTDLAVVDSDTIGADFARSINEKIIDLLLVMNFGEQARGAVYAEPQPVTNDSIESQDKIIEAAFGNLTVGPLLAKKIGWDDWFEDRDIPVVESERGPIEIPDPIEVAKAIASAKAPKPSNGNAQHLSAWQERTKRHLVLAGRELPWEDER